MLQNCSVSAEGRLVMPAIWNESVLHRLPDNYNLAYSVLKSCYKKYHKQPEKLQQYDMAIKQQLSQGIIEEINPSSIENDPNISFLAHNAVFKGEDASTKCRIVFLSNICDKRDKNNLSHNQVSLPGCQLNNKLQTTAILYRFNKYLFIYDLEKAFLQLCLRDEDIAKLHFLWFRDLAKGDKSIVIYRFSRVPFGLRFSPYLLMLALYIVLILCVAICDPDELFIRRMCYNLSYMDNLAFSSSDKKELVTAFKLSNKVFAEYKFSLQQYATNCDDLHAYFSDDSETTKLFGLSWNKCKDTFAVENPKLEAGANTKRQILASINAVFDPLGIVLPTILRAKLFLHKLHTIENLKWDTKLNDTLTREWKNIAKQFNSSSKICIPRYVGDYSSQYVILAFADASNDAYGVVLYLKDCITGKISFLLSRNRLIPLSNRRTIPILELQALKFGVETAQDIKNELCQAFCPVDIVGVEIFTDSMIALNWLSAKTNKFSKIEKKGVAVNNALNKIVDITNSCPMTFYHVDGNMNPADFMTRGTSAKLLSKSNFFCGPPLNKTTPMFSVPANPNEIFPVWVNAATSCIDDYECVFPLDRYSSFRKLCKVVHYVRKYVCKLKLKVKAKHESLFRNFAAEDYSYEKSITYIIRCAQISDYPDIFEYFKNSTDSSHALVNQLNLSLCRDGLLRVKGKCKKLNQVKPHRFPILLHKKSKLSDLLINDYHKILGHAGVYKVLSLIRERFWIPSGYSTVKKCLNRCIPCKKLYGRQIKINQSDYKDYLINPSHMPYRRVALDHIGPVHVLNDVGQKVKVYILIVTCLFTRAINLIPCTRINTECFLECLQLHIFNYGMPEFILSDNGSPIVSSINLIKTFLDDVDVKNFLTSHNIKTLSFQPYPSNASYLGGLVESLVKQVKNMLFVSIGKKVLTYGKFCLFVQECKMLINKRPIAFKNTLSDGSIDTDISCITPEKLLNGYDVPCIAVIPPLHGEADNSLYEPLTTQSHKKLYDAFKNLKVVKDKLTQAYAGEFLHNLRYQSVRTPGAYSSKNHLRLEPGDVVSIKTSFSKPYDYACGVVTQTESNDLGEVVHASLRKANGEIIRRHVTDLIFLMKSNSLSGDLPPPESNSLDPNVSQRPKRKTAIDCEYKLAQLQNQGAI